MAHGRHSHSQTALREPCLWRKSARAPHGSVQRGPAAKAGASRPSRSHIPGSPADTAMASRQLKLGCTAVASAPSWVSSCAMRQQGSAKA